MALSMVVVTVLLVVGSVSTARLAMAGRSRGEAQATYAAESAIARATAAFLEDRTPSRAQQPADTVIEDREAGWSARLTWKPDQGLPYSTNLWDTDESKTGWDGYAVPKRSLHLVAVGRCRGVERVVQTVLHIPPFPYVIASSGTVNSDGGLLVTGVADAKDVAIKDGVVTIPQEKETAGHVASNGTGDPALLLGPDTEVTGDVRAAGEITLDPGAVVRGEVRPKVDPIGIPKLDIDSYDPAGRPGVQHLDNEEYPNSTYTDRLKLEGFVRRAGNLEVTSKGLELKGAVLFVDGDLEVRGPIEGKGALIVTGDCTLHGGAKLSTDNEAALVVGGDVEIQGDGRQSTFVGLVYTEGNFTAEDITLVGAFVANNVSSAGSAMRMNRVNLVSIPSKTDFSFARTLNARYFDTKMTGWAFGNGNSWNFQSEALMTEFLTEPRIPDSPLSDANLTTTTAKITYRYNGAVVDKETFIRRMEGRVPLPPVDSRPDTCKSATTWRAFVAGSEAEIIRLIREAIAKANKEYQQSQTEAWEFKLDLNRFVSLEDRIRTTLWETNETR